MLALLAGACVLSGCATRRGPEARLLRLARAADAAYQSGDFDSARRKYELLLEANPKYAMANVRIGAIAYREGDVSAARAQFEVAAKKDPKNAQAKYNLAMLSLKDATRLLNEYAALGPQAPNRERVLVLLSRLREFAAK